MRLEDRAVRERVARLDALLEEVEVLPDPTARDLVMETIQGLLELYGEGLARVLEHIGRLPSDGERACQSFADDELIAHLLLLHGLHPVDPETRVRQALEEVRPYLESHGGGGGTTVALLGIEDGVAHLRMERERGGCPSTARALTEKIDRAVQEAAPDLRGIDAKEIAPPAGFVPMASLRRVEKHASSIE